MRTVLEVWQQVRDLLPADAKLASGGLEDARGISDVDVVLFSSTAEPEYYSIPGYDREVNVLVTNDAKRLRSVVHRDVQIELEEKFPQLVPKARAAKAAGAGTEAAWAAVLCLSGCHYDAMADRSRVMAAAHRMTLSVSR